MKEGLTYVLKRGDSIYAAFETIEIAGMCIAKSGIGILGAAPETQYGGHRCWMLGGFRLVELPLNPSPEALTQLVER